MAKLKGTHAEVRPLYTTSPAAQRKPLTDEEIKQALTSVDPETKRLPPGMKAFACAIEAAAQPAQWDKPSASFDEWWDGDYDDLANPYHTGTPAYWAWAGWVAAQPEQVDCPRCGHVCSQRPWQGLTEEEIQELRLKSFDAIATNHEIYRAIEARLKERNNG
jgi:hypothetical protein